VAVKVRVERRTGERVQLDRFAFHQCRLKRLNAETVQRGSAIQQNGMVFNDFFENVPNNRILLLYQFLRLLDRGAVTALLQPVINERLEQFERHLLRKAALIQAQLGTDHNHRTAGVINALAEQVLAEASLLSFERVRQRFERAVVGSAKNAAAASVVEQR